MSATRSPVGVHHVAVKVRDLEGVAAFYRDVLQLAPAETWHSEDGELRGVWLRAGSTRIVLERAAADLPGRPPEFGAAAPGWHLVALEIPAGERIAWGERLREAGVAVVRESPWSLFFQDPEGNRLALTHYPAQHDAPGVI